MQPCTCTWCDVATQMADVPGSEMAAVVGSQADAEALVALKDFMNSFGCERLCTEESFPMDGSGYVHRYVLI